MANPWIEHVKKGWPAAKKKGLSYKDWLVKAKATYKKKKRKI